jgi:hypothetical protein
MGGGGGGYVSGSEGGGSRKIPAKNKKVIFKKYLDKLKL